MSLPIAFLAGKLIENMGTFVLKPLGAVLYQADLIPLTVVEQALKFQDKYGDRRLGEILIIWGKLPPETINFFAEEWPRLFYSAPKERFGQYLKAAALLDEAQIQEILYQQQGVSARFGMIAVRKGWLKQTTVDFFLRHLMLEKQLREILLRDGWLNTDSNIPNQSRENWREILFPSVFPQFDQELVVKPLQLETRDNEISSIRLLMEGVVAWNTWRKANPSQVPDLSKADLKLARLQSYDLSATDLNSADLRGADLRGAILSEAYPLGADFSEADLSGADLRKCYLCGANFSGANLSGANLSEANLLSANLCRANFHHANLSGAILTRTQALATNFAQANLSGANIDDWQIDRETILDFLV